jgi:single-strand DNA-binding protein
MLSLTAIGHIGKDAELKDVNGKKVIRFSLCVDQSYKNKEGVKVEKTTWIDCNFWNQEKIAPYLKKGTMIFVSGEPGTHGYMSKDNAIVSLQTLTIQTLELLNTKKEN